MSRQLGPVVLLSLLGIAAASSPALVSPNRTADTTSQPPPNRWTSDTTIETPPTEHQYRPESVTDCFENQCVDRSGTDGGGEVWRSLVAFGCFCDKDCVFFGDCCRDAPGAATVYEEITCVGAGPNEYYRSIDVLSMYMVSHCPTSWAHNPTRQACEAKDVSFNDDPLAAMPVTNTRSRLTYRNAACARCHEDTTALEIWSAELECRDLWPSQANDATAETLRRNRDGRWGVTRLEDGVAKFSECYIRPKSPGWWHVRRCLPSVSDCAPDWTDPDTAAECAAYTARVRDMSKRNARAEGYRHVYRNLHCALCNGVTLHVLQCGVLIDFLTADYHPPRFSLIIDFNDRSGSETVGKVTRCNGTHRWDSFFHKCRAVFCDAGHVLGDDECVPATDPSPRNASHAEPSGFRVCPKFYLSDDEFEIRSNGNVYVELYDRVYVDGEFELRDGELAVCSLSSDLGKFDDTLGILSLVFLAASVLCLCCHLVLFCLVSEQRNLPGKNLATLCVCLLLGYVCFLAAPSQEAGTAGCRAIGIVMYAAFIASFLWMNVMAFDVFRSLRYVYSDFTAFCLQ